jgi:hypothetical protein
LSAPKGSHVTQAAATAPQSFVEEVVRHWLPEQQPVLHVWAQPLQTPDAQDSPAGQRAHVPPAIPQASCVFPGRQRSWSQQPAQEAEVHRHTPPTQTVPLGHVPHDEPEGPTGGLSASARATLRLFSTMTCPSAVNTAVPPCSPVTLTVRVLPEIAESSSTRTVCGLGRASVATSGRNMGPNRRSLASRPSTLSWSTWTSLGSSMCTSTEVDDSPQLRTVAATAAKKRDFVGEP